MFSVGYYQFKPVFGAVKKNRDKILIALKNTAADLLVLPELPFTGYFFYRKEELLSFSEDPKDSETVAIFSEFCHKNKLHIVTGFAEKSGEKVYNSALLIGPEGLIYTYRKLHLFDKEKKIFEPGNRPPEVQHIKDIKIGTMICFDWIFPETMRILSLSGAQIICHPSNLVLSYCQQAMLTRCLENNVFAITANRFGTEHRPHGSIRFTGKSQIVAPRGHLLHRAYSQKEELTIIEIDPQLARNKRITNHNDLFEDRRSEFYVDICSKNSF